MTHCLSPGEIMGAADRLGCEPAVIAAVITVESGGGWFTDIRRRILDTGGRRGGFLVTDRQPAILFEAHWFSRLTGHRFDRSHPDISAPRWDRSLYRGGSREYERLDRAMALNREAALKAASWGLFQILGVNHASTGHTDIESFVTAMYSGERAHLAAFCTFLERRSLVAPLRRRDWEAFATGYNGPGHAANDYVGKLKWAYANARHAGSLPSGRKPKVNSVLSRGAVGPEVERLQRKLGITDDGDFGPLTEQAVRAFQARMGADVDGIVGPVTWALLQKERGELPRDSRAPSETGGKTGPDTSPPFGGFFHALIAVFHKFWSSS